MLDFLWFLVLMVLIVLCIGIAVVITGRRGDGYFCDDCGHLSEIHHNGACDRAGCGCGKE